MAHPRQPPEQLYARGTWKPTTTLISRSRSRLVPEDVSFIHGRISCESFSVRETALYNEALIMAPMTACTPSGRWAPTFNNSLAALTIRVEDRRVSTACISDIQRLTEAVNRLADVMERLPATNEELAHSGDSRYVPGSSMGTMLNEEAMAGLLEIRKRKLAEYRRQGKLPGCWVKNGRRVRWNVRRTLEAWQRGVA